MNPRRDDPEEEGAFLALGALGRAARPARTPEQESRARARLVAAWQAPPQRRGARVVALGLGGALAAAAAIALLLLRPAPRIEYAIEEHAPAAAPGPVTAGAAGTTLRFSEGTRAHLRPGTRTRVVETTPRGARLAVDGGTLRMDVVPRARGRWAVEAGPYVVRVTGTVFEVSWDPAARRFTAALFRGGIEVTGPGVQGGVRLAAGQSLTASAEDGRISIRSLTPQELGRPGGAPAAAAARGNDQTAAAAPPAAASAPAPAAGAPPPPRPSAIAPPPVGRPRRTEAPLRLALRGPARGAAPAPVAPAATEPPRAAGAAGPRAPALLPPPIPTAAPPAPQALPPTPPRAPPPAEAAPSWPSQIAAGHFAAVVAAAGAEGIAAALARRGLADLVALADAARYTQDGELARRALLAQRARFVGSSAALRASFLLGRLDEAAGDHRAAIAWYERYAREAPGGPLRQEALGRQMLAHDALGDRAGARRAAQAYVSAFARGPHTELARRILGLP